MNQTELTIRDVPGLCPGARVYRLTCRHGSSSAALVPGAKPLSDVVVLDVVLPGHHRRYRCSCEPTPPIGLRFTAHA